MQRLLILAVLALTPAVLGQSYSVVVLQGGAPTVGYGLTPTGIVVGGVGHAPCHTNCVEAAYWRGGEATVIAASIPGSAGYVSIGMGVSDSGRIAGALGMESTPNGDRDINAERWFVWDAGTALAFDPPLGANRIGSLAVSGHGDVAGASMDLGRFGSDRPFIWLQGQTQTPWGGGRAHGMSRLGVVVGDRPGGISGAYGGCAWTAGQLVFLDGDCGPGSRGAYGVSESGIVVGNCGERPAFWTLGSESPQVTMLPLPLGVASGRADAVNNSGEIVGFTYSDYSVALLWRNGELIDLNTAVAPMQPYILRKAVAINNAGQIVVNASPGLLGDGLTRALLLTPPVCAGYIRGDANCDGMFNNFDIDAFVVALTTPMPTWTAEHPVCNWLCNLDMNNDGRINNYDIDPFVDALIGG